MKISRFLNNPGKPFHSNGYARVANGDSMGSVSLQSFGERSSIEKNRQVVKRYGDSHIARGSVRQFRAGAPLPQRAAGKQTFTSSERQAGPQPRTRFVEPPTRSYNPYK